MCPVCVDTSTAVIARIAAKEHRRCSAESLPFSSTNLDESQRAILSRLSGLDSSDTFPATPSRKRPRAVAQLPVTIVAIAAVHAAPEPLTNL
jgi:hypothetical protein